MPSTHLALHYHLVFGTKNREALIDEIWRPLLHDYLGGAVRGLGGFSQRVGGVADHVHLLIGLKAVHCVADIVREIKKASCQWVRHEIGQRAFSWQEGYAAFTVSATARDGVRTYITNQEAHHRIVSFREEWIELLERAGIEIDSKQLD